MNWMDRINADAEAAGQARKAELACDPCGAILPRHRPGCPVLAEERRAKAAAQASFDAYEAGLE